MTNPPRPVPPNTARLGPAQPARPGRDASVNEDMEPELGFEPMIPATGGDPAAGARGAASTRRRLRRRLGAGVLVLAALVLMGGGYALFASSSGASDTGNSAADIAAGKQLYATSCITCHGANLQGVTGQGEPLIGVGSAAVYFQISTGRMPLTGQGAQATRKPAQFSQAQIDQLAAYVQSIGGGPQLPTGNLRDANIAEGGSLFRLNCASCHGFTGAGAPLTAGKFAPSLSQATDRQLYAAMLSGPEDMPIFSDNQLTATEKRQIISYIQTLKASKDPGGNGIGRIGPVSEGLVIWTVGIGAVMIAILWIGAKSR